MNTKILLLFFVIFSLSFQAPEYKLHSVINASSDFITTDNLGNCYIVRNDVVDKYNSSGTFLQAYSNKSYGRISHVDASNPMKPMVFYRDIAQAVFLDNTMTVQGDPVRFGEDEFPDIQLICVSRENGLWIYVSQNAELIRLNEQLQITHRTGNLNQVLGMSISPSYLIEYNNKVYLNSPAEGILVFDVFGTYYKTIPLKYLQSFQVQEDEIIYQRDGKLASHNIKTLEMQEYPLPDSTALSFRFEKHRLYIRKPGTVLIYDAR